MIDEKQMDELLRRSLRAEETEPVPSAQLQRETLQKLEERYNMTELNSKNKRRLCSAILAAALVVGVPAGAFAAWQMLSPAQIAVSLQDKGLEQAFQSEDAVAINETVESGDYKITLLGMVSGAACSDYLSDDVQLDQERVYAALAMEKLDGTPMPDHRSDAYAEQHFLASPLIQGQLPWQVNIFTMGGGYSEFVQDGVLYRMVECDDVTAFADRNVWLAVTDEFSISNSTFLYDEKTGNISANPDAQGVNVLFRLPLDANDADPMLAEQKLQQWLNDEESDFTPDDGKASMEDTFTEEETELIVCR